jgi:PAS domain S-box-containing protein
MLTPYMIMDRSLMIVYANPAYLQSTECELDELIGRNIFDVFPDADDRVAPIRHAFNRTLDGETTRLERTYYRFHHSDGTTSTKCWQCTQTPYYGSDGGVQYIIQNAEDITESDLLRQRNEIVERELDHRVKNLFSVIQAVASLSGQKARTIEDFRNEFSARVAAMGRTHDQLREQNWEGLWLHEIIQEGLEQFCGSMCDKVVITGPDVRLSPRGVQHTSMLVHELATNAAKYGCFSVPDGRLQIRTTHGDDAHSLKVEWKESGLDGIVEPERTGFGTQLTSFMPNLKCERRFEEDGFRLTVEARLLHPMDDPHEAVFRGP